MAVGKVVIIIIHWRNINNFMSSKRKKEEPEAAVGRIKLTRAILKKPDKDEDRDNATGSGVAFVNQGEGCKEKQKFKRRSTRRNRFEGNYNLEAKLEDSGILPASKATAALQSQQQERTSQKSTASTTKAGTLAKKEPTDENDGHLIIKLNSTLSPRCMRRITDC